MTTQTEVIQLEELSQVNLAVAGYDTLEAGLADLEARFKGVLFPVETNKGLEDARKARAEIREPRYLTEKLRKQAKEPLLKLGRQVDAKAKYITERLVAIEDPIDAQIKDQERKIEEEKAEKARIEAARVAGIKAKIETIRSNLVGLNLLCSDNIAALLDGLATRAVTEAEFAEFTAEAEAAKAQTLEIMQTALTERRIQEEELARMKAERERIEAENKRIADERAAFEAERAAFQKQQREAAEAEQKRLAAPVFVPVDVAATPTGQAVAFEVGQDERVEGFSIPEMIEDHFIRIGRAIQDEPTVYDGLITTGSAAMLMTVNEDGTIISEPVSIYDQPTGLTINANQLRAALAIAEALSCDVTLIEGNATWSDGAGIYAAASGMPEEGFVFLPA